MANSYHTFNNCNKCNQRIYNGVLRDGNLYCSDNCYKKVHFGSVNITAYVPNNKQCNYCFDTFDNNRINGIEYGPMWFCCQHHLNLANPRPKVMMVQRPILGPTHNVPLIGGTLFVPRIGYHPYFIGPF